MDVDHDARTESIEDIPLIQGGSVIGYDDSLDDSSEIHEVEVKEESSNGFFIACVCLGLLGAFLFNHFSVKGDIQIQKLKTELIEKVYDQTVSVNVVIKNLEQNENWGSKVKVLAFVGTQGVGKTFVANIIKKHFPQNLVHESFGLHFGYKGHRDAISKSLDSCCLNLVIVDDLEKKDDIELFEFVQSIPKRHSVLIIAIFNLYNTNPNLKLPSTSDQAIDIQNSFSQSGLHYDVTVFEDFSFDQAKDWLTHQLNLLNVSSAVRGLILTNVLKQHDIKAHGLKGLYTKMLFEIEQFKR